MSINTEGTVQAQGFQDFSGDRHLVRRITFTGAMGEKYETSVVFDYRASFCILFESTAHRLAAEGPIN